MRKTFGVSSKKIQSFQYIKFCNFTNHPNFQIQRAFAESLTLFKLLLLRNSWWSTFLSWYFLLLWLLLKHIPGSPSTSLPIYSLHLYFLVIFQHFKHCDPPVLPMVLSLPHFTDVLNLDDFIHLYISSAHLFVDASKMRPQPWPIFRACKISIGSSWRTSSHSWTQAFPGKHIKDCGEDPSQKFTSLCLFPPIALMKTCLIC